MEGSREETIEANERLGGGRRLAERWEGVKQWGDGGYSQSISYTQRNLS